MSGPDAPERTTGRRAALGLAALVVVALGLTIRALGDGEWAGPAGDSLYAVLVYLVVALAMPGKPGIPVAALALVVCVAIELFQLTGIPAELGRARPLLRLALGTTFGAADLVAYAGGVATAYAVDRTIAGRRIPR